MTSRLRLFVFCGWGVLFLGGVFSVGRACGPFFPETILDSPRATLRQPFVSFETEVRSAAPPAEPGPAVARPEEIPVDRYAYYRSRVAEMVGPEVKEMEAVLAKEPEEQRNETVAEYRALREAMLAQYYFTEEDDRRGLDLSTTGAALLARAEQGRWPAGLPKDVVLYLQGAMAYHHGEKAKAVETWERLLALPAAERQNRSVAAAWMIAMTMRDTAGFEAALPWYEKCVQLSTEGYRDCLGLGLASLGWEARYYLDKGDRRKAAVLYYHQAMGGDAMAWVSLRQSLPDIYKMSDEELTEWAKVPFLRGVMTADVLRGYFDYAEPAREAEVDAATRWLAAIERAEAGEVQEAGRLAELAYSSGHFDLAKRWVRLAAKDDARALWVRGKIALMEGDTAAAERNLLAAQAGFPREQATYADRISLRDGFGLMPTEETEAYRTSQFYGDLGLTLLARDRYAEALDALDRGGFFSDAAYVAERVLSPQELLAYVRKKYPEPVPASNADEGYDVRPDPNLMRYLLARRLGRMRSFQLARSFYPAEMQPVFDRYAELMRKSGPDQPKAARAQALWEAAQIHRAAGMELFGTEDAPDFKYYDGGFGGGVAVWDRVGVVFGERSPDWRGPIDPKSFVPLATAGERERVLQSRMAHEERFQYRYVAADMGWQAAQLMPNKSEETARVLGIAGCWLENEDPKAADRFYKAMIWRNWSTPLAREADKKRWFPEIAWEYDPWAAAGVTRPDGY